MTLTVLFKKNIPVKNFYGDHHILFTDVNKKSFENSFSPDAFKLVNVPENVVRNQELCLHFANLNLRADDYIELFSVDTDASFSITYSAKDGSKFISIPSNELKQQRGAQLKLSATLYKKIPLQQNTKDGGTLEIVYPLKPFIVNLLAEKTLYNLN